MMKLINEKDASIIQMKVGSIVMRIADAENPSSWERDALHLKAVIDAMRLTGSITIVPHLSTK
jgi:hypothetical protein